MPRTTIAQPLPRRFLAACRTAGAALVYLLIAIPGASAQTAASPPLDLPGSFQGTLPCADCPGVDWQLDLWPDRRFHLQRRYRDREVVNNAVGRWHWSADRATLTLDVGADTALQLAIAGPDRLRLLDRHGQHIDSSLPYELRRGYTLKPAELALTLGGEFRYLADAAAFTECATGHRYPVLMQGDYLALERAYSARTPALAGAPVYALVDATIVNEQAMAGEGPAQSLRVERFVTLQPGMSCERAMSTASLTNTYWKLLSLGAAPVPTMPDRPEAHFILGEGAGNGDSDGEPDVHGVGGCNRFSGSYHLDGTSLSFPAPLASTRMFCPPPLDDLERRFFAALEQTAEFRITAQLLELYDEAGQSLAVFEAVYLP